MYESPESKSWNPFGIELWIAWMAATGLGVAGMTTFLYMNFQTKDAFAEYRFERTHIDESLVKRLDRIEDKIDRLLKQ